MHEGWTIEGSQGVEMGCRVAEEELWLHGSKKMSPHSTSPNEPTDVTECNEYHMCSLQSRGSCYMNHLQSERDSD